MKSIFKLATASVLLDVVLAAKNTIPPDAWKTTIFEGKSKAKNYTAFSKKVAAKIEVEVDKDTRSYQVEKGGAIYNRWYAHDRNDQQRPKIHKELFQWKSCMEYMTEELSDEQLRKEFKAFDHNGTGNVSLAEADGAIEYMLDKCYQTDYKAQYKAPANSGYSGKDTKMVDKFMKQASMEAKTNAKHIFKRYRPSLILAFNNAKDTGGDKTKTNAEDVITFDEFKNFLKNVSVYGAMYEAFLLVQDMLDLHAIEENKAVGHYKERYPDNKFSREQWENAIQMGELHDLGAIQELAALQLATPKDFDRMTQNPALWSNGEIANPRITAKTSPRTTSKLHPNGYVTQKEKLLRQLKNPTEKMLKELKNLENERQFGKVVPDKREPKVIFKPFASWIKNFQVHVDSSETAEILSEGHGYLQDAEIQAAEEKARQRKERLKKLKNANNNKLIKILTETLTEVQEEADAARAKYKEIQADMADMLEAHKKERRKFTHGQGKFKIMNQDGKKMGVLKLDKAHSPISSPRRLVEEA